MIADIVDDNDVKQELAAGGQFSGVEQEVYVPYPFDSDKIAISSKIYPLLTIVRRLERGMIVAAEMQRGEDLWDIGRKSRLIESILLKIPLPLFYAAENKESILSIVDGLQRINAIHAYVSQNSFGLKELEFLKDLEGKRFKDLSENLRIRIEETELQFVVIQPDSPPEIQRNIFKRLNTGGLPLSDQEIRHALYYGPVADLLKEFALTPDFIQATTESVNDSRMAARELILRFISFLIIGVEGYNKDDEMDGFLCDAMQIVNALYSKNPPKNGDAFNKRIILCDDLTTIKSKFSLAMSRASQLFEKFAFRMSIRSKHEEGTPRKPINKALFEAWSVILSNIRENEFGKLLEDRNKLDDELGKIYDISDPFRRYCGSDSLKVSGVKGRHETIKKIVRQLLEGDDV
jgi:hypothetical protein